MEHAVRIVRSVVAFHRLKGGKSKASIAIAADELGVGRQLANDLYYREPRRKSILASEYQRLKAGMLDHLDKKMAALQAEVEATERQRAEAKADKWHSSGSRSRGGRFGGAGGP